MNTIRFSSMAFSDDWQSALTLLLSLFFSLMKFRKDDERLFAFSPWRSLVDFKTKCICDSTHTYANGVTVSLYLQIAKTVHGIDFHIGMSKKRKHADNLMLSLLILFTHSFDTL